MHPYRTSHKPKKITGHYKVLTRFVRSIRVDLYGLYIQTKVWYLHFLDKSHVEVPWYLRFLGIKYLNLRNVRHKCVVCSNRARDLMYPHGPWACHKHRYNATVTELKPTVHDPDPDC